MGDISGNRDEQAVEEPDPSGILKAFDDANAKLIESQQAEKDTLNLTRTLNLTSPLIFLISNKFRKFVLKKLC